MSRAYRIRVSESLQKELRAGDSAHRDIELLPILPCDEMTAMLVDELIARGFQWEGAQLVRIRDDMTVRIDPEQGRVSVHAELKLDLDLQAKGVGYADEDAGEQGRRESEEHLRRRVQTELARQAAARAEELTCEATERLAAEIKGIVAELDQAVNRVTIAALKRKAAQLGTIKRLTEDPLTGSMTIVLEV
ncbi:MAG TPA: hypothetical protein VHB77_19145 [Planctomycetaceae bacterium]|nr:hypothetical protein [Planctomycetaceae bacterium]